jgi:membrane-associated phospholipid phosphatase
MTRPTTFEERGGPEQGIANRLRSWSPPAVAAAVAVLGYLVLTILLVGIGLILTKLLIPEPVGAWDNSVNRWFVGQRTPTGNTLTDYASILAGTGTVLVIVGATAVILAIRHFWREVGFLLIVFFIEFSVFLTTVMLIDRPRPTVPKLDAVPATSSFPSGHVAASIVLYVGLAILISAHTRHTLIRVVVWVIAVMIVVGVGISRVYRGLHHPTDVFAGLILGVGALLFAVLAIRAADAASRHRPETTTETPTRPQPSEVHP